MRVTGDVGFEESEEPWENEVRAAWDVLRGVIGDENPFTFNDAGDHERVLVVLDRAIEVAASAPQHRTDSADPGAAALSKKGPSS